MRCRNCGASRTRARGYQEVHTPILYDVELWKQSGHWDKYRDHMYFTDVGGAPDGPQADELPGPHPDLQRPRGARYRDLPIRLAEQGLVHRHEPSGTLHGLLRVRSITQDDAHIFCTEEQIEEEVIGCLDFAFYLYDVFGFEPRLELSTRPPNRIGSDEMWDQAEGALRGALEHRGLDYDVHEGDGAFYGPKIDLHMTDSIGRSWQLGTVQLDYAMPERFGMTYTGADNADHTPVMIHRALFGSFERLIGILIEHLRRGVSAVARTGPGDRAADRRPPQRVRRRRGGRLRTAGLRAELDDRDESVGRKIRDAELRKIPYMLVVGDREQERDEVGVREHRHGDRGSELVEDPDRAAPGDRSKVVPAGRSAAILGCVDPSFSSHTAGAA